VQSSGEEVHQNWQREVEKMAMWIPSQSDKKERQKKTVFAETHVRLKNATQAFK
jgi:hypothetical protein